jgi:hypothetical protein
MEKKVIESKTKEATKFRVQTFLWLNSHARFLRGDLSKEG